MNENSAKATNSDPQKPLCYSCVHRLDIPGNCHSRCNSPQSRVSADDRGIRGGWFRWPLNFDPVWLKSCDGYSADPADKKERVEHNPIAELLGLLG